MVVKKIAIVGPESTGKSTLAQQLAAHFDCPFVPEYARTYLDQLGRPYEETDLLQIAQGQLAQETNRVDPGCLYLFCDTNLLTLKIWAEDKFGRCDPWIEDHLSLDTYALHLLTYPDLPWEADPQREDPERLEELFARYGQALQEAQVPYFIVTGKDKVRFSHATKAIQALT